MLTKAEILSRLKRDKVNMGKNPGSTFNYYIWLGLLPQPQSRRNRAGVYPEDIVDTIKLIRDYQRQGWRLTKIKEVLDVIGERRTWQEKLDHFRAWENEDERRKRLRKILGLDKSQGHDSYPFSVKDQADEGGSSYVIVAVNHPDQITWVCVDITVPDEERVLGEEIMTKGEYNLFVRTLADQKIENGKIIKHSDIFRTVYQMYFSHREGSSSSVSFSVSEGKQAVKATSSSSSIRDGKKSGKAARKKVL